MTSADRRSWLSPSPPLSLFLNLSYISSLLLDPPHTIRNACGVSADAEYAGEGESETETHAGREKKGKEKEHFLCISVQCRRSGHTYVARSAWGIIIRTLGTEASYLDYSDGISSASRDARSRALVYMRARGCMPARRQEDITARRGAALAMA